MFRCLVSCMRASAILKGYERFKVKNHVFPAIIERNNVDCSVEGLVVENLTMNELNVFDLFEDIEYKRCDVCVQVESDLIDAQVYVWNTDRAWLSAESWSYDCFRSEHLEWYLENTVKPFRDEINALDLLQ
mmetsp:Transcript_2044/g.2734  ORF Transcript_2044/g.2734 Transcript_2044/m.2734 type:complete len:131 (-) Transcript_2044:488-880(-)